MTRLHVRLRYVDTVDFRKSETTNYRLLPADIRESLRDGDAVCFKNEHGNQVVFVVKPRPLPGVASIQRKDGSTDAAEVVCSIRLRLPHERPWNPTMLADYAHAAGLELIGIRRLVEHLARERHAEVPP